MMDIPDEPIILKLILFCCSNIMETYTGIFVLISLFIHTFGLSTIIQ